MPFNVGDWIEKAPHGNGQITEDRGTFFTIRFVSVGEKKFAKGHVIKPGAPPHPGFKFIEKTRSRESSKARARRSLGPAYSFEHLFDRFVGAYPLGFDDPAFDNDERQYKEEAVKRFAATLGKTELNR